MNDNDLVVVEGFAVVLRHQARSEANRIRQELADNPLNENLWSLGKAFAKAANGPAYHVTVIIENIPAFFTN